MRQLMTLLCFVLLSNFAHSQKIGIEFVGRTLFTPQSTNESSRYFENQNIFYRNSDTTLVFITRNSTIFYKQTYKPELGFELLSRIDIPIAKRFSIKAGMGLQYFSFEYEDQFIDTESEIISEEVVIDRRGFSNPFTCDGFTNSFPSDVNFSTYQQNVANLLIPIELKYSLIPNRIDIMGGLFFQTPIASNLRQEQVFTEQELGPNNEILCTYNLLELNDRTGNFLNNAQLGVSFNTSWRVLDPLAIELGVRQNISNLFSNHNFDFPSGRNLEYQPLFISAGVSYRLLTKPQDG